MTHRCVCTGLEWQTSAPLPREQLALPALETGRGRGRRGEDRSLSNGGSSLERDEGLRPCSGALCSVARCSTRRDLLTKTEIERERNGGRWQNRPILTSNFRTSVEETHTHLSVLLLFLLLLLLLSCVTGHPILKRRKRPDAISDNLGSLLTHTHTYPLTILTLFICWKLKKHPHKSTKSWAVAKKIKEFSMNNCNYITIIQTLTNQQILASMTSHTLTTNKLRKHGILHCFEKNQGVFFFFFLPTPSPHTHKHSHTQNTCCEFLAWLHRRTALFFCALCG